MNRLPVPTALALVFSLFFGSLASAAEPWQLRKQEDGISVYTRRVDGSPVLEFRSEMTVPRPIEKVLAFYEDETRMPEWFHQCRHSELLEKSEDVKVLYFILDMPWPVADRDCVYKRLRALDASGAVVFTIAADDRPHAKPEGAVRVTYLKTEWRFTPVQGGTRIEYQQHSNAGGRLPAPLINALVVSIPFRSFKNLKSFLVAIE